MASREDPRLCVSCGYMIDGSTTADGTEISPVEGEVALCMNCGALYCRHDRRWLPITEDELAGLEPDLRRELARIEAARSAAISRDLTEQDPSA